MTLEPCARQGGYARGRRMAIETDRAESSRAFAADARPDRRSPCSSATRIWKTGRTPMHVEPDGAAGSTGANRAAVVVRAPVTPTSPARSSTSRRHSRRAGARQRARDRGTRRRRSIARQLLAAIRLRHHQPHHRHRRRRPCRRAPVCVRVPRARSRPKRRSDVPIPPLEQQMIAAIDAAKEAGDTLGGASK